MAIARRCTWVFFRGSLRGAWTAFKKKASPYFPLSFWGNERFIVENSWKSAFFSQFCRSPTNPDPQRNPSCRHWTSQSGRPSVCACFLLISFLLRTGRRSEHGCTRILKSMRWIESRSAFCQLSFYRRDFIASSQLKSFLPECFGCLSSHLIWVPLSSHPSDRTRNPGRLSTVWERFALPPFVRHLRHIILLRIFSGRWRSNRSLPEIYKKHIIKA